MLLLVALSPANGLNGLSSVSPWSVLGLSVFKQCTEVQLSNSIFKIFKMRLTRTCGLGRCVREKEREREGEEREREKRERQR